MSNAIVGLAVVLAFSSLPGTGRAAVDVFSCAAGTDSLVVDLSQPASRITSVTLTVSGSATLAHYMCRECVPPGYLDCWDTYYDGFYEMSVRFVAGDSGYWGSLVVTNDGTFDVDGQALWTGEEATGGAVTTAAITCSSFQDSATYYRCYGSHLDSYILSPGELTLNGDIELTVTYDVAVPNKQVSWGAIKATYR